MYRRFSYFHAYFASLGKIEANPTRIFVSYFTQRFLCGCKLENVFVRSPMNYHYAIYPEHRNDSLVTF